MVADSLASSSKVSSLKCTIMSSLCTTPLFRNEAFLREKYEQEELSARQIAFLIGCSHSVINAALDRYGIKKTKRRRGWVEYGWKLLRGRRVPHTRHQKVIQQIKKWRDRGWSFAQISDRLNKRAVLSPSKTTNWYPSTVKRVLKYLHTNHTI